MEHGARLSRTAEALEKRVANALHDLPGTCVPEERAGALRDMLHYVTLLRGAATGSETSYAFKVELPDGRWDVAEQMLPGAPRIGDLVQLGGGGRWQVVRTQLVWPRPSGKPPREFFVCAPAA